MPSHSIGPFLEPSFESADDKPFTMLVEPSNRGDDVVRTSNSPIPTDAERVLQYACVLPGANVCC